MTNPDYDIRVSRDLLVSLLVVADFVHSYDGKDIPPGVVLRARLARASWDERLKQEVTRA